MLHINKQMLHHLTSLLQGKNLLLCSPETLTESHYWYALLMNIEKQLEEFKTPS